jgi:nitrogen fixation protein FixH
MNYKYIILLIVGIALGVSFTYIVAPNTYTSSKELDSLNLELAKSQALIALYDSSLVHTIRERAVAIEERDKYKGKLDTTFTLLQDLSKPKVTKDDYKEALLWIKDYNSSIQE